MEETNLSRPASSGTPIVISASNRPARRSAGSRESGRFVAPRIMTGLLPVLSQERSARSRSSARFKRCAAGVHTIHAC